MTTFPEPLATWNSIVKSTVLPHVTQVHTISPPQLVANVVQGEEYILQISFRNTSEVQLHYENVVIRLVGRPDQVEFPQGAIDHRGNPRIHLNMGYFPHGDERWESARFRARQSMATEDLRFDIGIYGYLVPQGHYWKEVRPTP